MTGRRRTFRCALTLGSLAAAAAGWGARAAAADPAFELSATERDWASYFPGYLANGYFSTLTAPRGTEGTPGYLVAFMDYAAGDISRPAAIPGWSEINYSPGDPDAGQGWLNAAPLDTVHFIDYRQTLDLRHALLTTAYRYVEGGRATSVQVRTLVSEADPHLAATELSLTPDFDGTVRLSFAFNLWAPHQPRFALATLTGPALEEALAANNLPVEAIAPATPDRAAVWYHGDTHVQLADGDPKTLALWISGQAEQGLAMAQAATVGLPPGLVPDAVTLYRSPYRLSLELTVRLERHRTYTFTKFVAVSRTGWGGDAGEDLKQAAAARAAGFESLRHDHAAMWEGLWQSDIVIDGDPAAQRAVHSDLYYLLASSTPDTAWPIGACGLTPGYAGHAFWDSDTWIFPALLLLQPDRARSLVMFRDRTLAAAQARAQARGLRGAKFPWESDPEYGTEQTPHPAFVLGEREIHVNADIAIAQWEYYQATGDRDWLRSAGWPVIRDLADFWVSRAVYDPGRQRYEIPHVTSVEEDYNDIPNDTFTNLSAAKALRIAVEAAAILGESADPQWSQVAAGLYIPFSEDQQHHLDFDATVPHSLPPWDAGPLPLLFLPSLDAAMSATVRRNDYEQVRPALRQPQRDPDSMGLAPTAIIAATAGDSAMAAEQFRRFLDNGTTKPPFNVRTETAHNNTGYFITGSGGLVQTLLYGFSGLRITDAGLVEAYPPMLPQGWRSLTLRQIAVRGMRYDIRIDRDARGRVRLTRIVAAP